MIYIAVLISLLHLNLCFTPVRASRPTTVSQEGLLVQDLFKNYDKRIKPTANASTQIVVALQFALAKVGGLVCISIIYIVTRSF